MLREIRVRLPRGFGGVAGRSGAAPGQRPIIPAPKSGKTARISWRTLSCISVPSRNDIRNRREAGASRMTRLLDDFGYQRMTALTLPSWSLSWSAEAASVSATSLAARSRPARGPRQVEPHEASSSRRSLESHGAGLPSGSQEASDGRYRKLFPRHETVHR
jgi:hypothetical protein